MVFDVSLSSSNMHASSIALPTVGEGNSIVQRYIIKRADLIEGASKD